MSLSDRFITKVRERQKRIVAEVMSPNIASWADYKALVAEYSGLEQGLKFAELADQEDSESLDSDS